MKAALTFMFLAVGLCAYQGLCFSDPFNCGKPCVHVATQCAPINMMHPHPTPHHHGGPGGHIFMTPQTQGQATQQATAQHVTYPSSYHPMMPSYCVQSVIVGGKSEQEEKKEDHTQNNHPEPNHEESDDSHEEESEEEESSEEEDGVQNSLRSNRVSGRRDNRNEESYRGLVESIVDQMNGRDAMQTVRNSRIPQNRLRISSSTRRSSSRSQNRHNHHDCDEDEEDDYYAIKFGGPRRNRVYRCRNVF